MARDHFKKLMFTPDFVKENREQLGIYNHERKIEKFFKAAIRRFKAIFGPWVSK